LAPLTFADIVTTYRSPTGESCDLTLILGGPLFTVFGIFFTYAGFYALFKPDSTKAQDFWVNQYSPEAEADRFSLFMGFTREHAGRNNLALGRFFGPLVGTIFTLAGLWMTVSAIRCWAQLPYFRAIFGPLAWHSVDATYITMVILTGAAGVWTGYKVRAVLRELYVLLVLCFAVAAAQAAAFHVGPQAPRWFNVAVLSGVLSAGVLSLNRRLSRVKDSTK
jgi:uncharacterized membrane protein YfcA